MENNGKINKSKYSAFKKNKGFRHFSASGKIISDALGSYTGIPVNEIATPEDSDLYPVQDADDL